jgi:hypothetical protein
MRDTSIRGGFVQPQKYFTDQNSDFDDVKKSKSPQWRSNAAQNDKFFFDPAEHVVTQLIHKAVTANRNLQECGINLKQKLLKSKILMCSR